MFERWFQFAFTYAQMIRVSPVVALRAHSMVCSMLGAAWFDKQERSLEFSNRTISDSHPLFLALRGSTKHCLVEVCELAGYVLAFQHDQGLGDIIVALRDAAKYQSAIQELAFAWKFRNAGAAVTLGPQTSTGIADLSVEVADRRYIVEVSGFSSDLFRDDLTAFTGAMQNALDSGLFSDN
jgi:hypothetical protein